MINSIFLPFLDKIIIFDSSRTIQKNILVVSYSSGEIYALNANDGTLIWFDNITSGNFFSKSPLNDIQSPLSIVGNMIFVPTFYHTIKRAWLVHC